VGELRLGQLRDESCDAFCAACCWSVCWRSSQWVCWLHTQLLSEQSPCSYGDYLCPSSRTTLTTH